MAGSMRTFCYIQMDGHTDKQQSVNGLPKWQCKARPGNVSEHLLPEPNASNMSSPIGIGYMDIQDTCRCLVHPIYPLHNFLRLLKTLHHQINIFPTLNISTPHKEPKTAQYTNARAKAETIHKNLGFLHSHGDAT